MLKRTLLLAALVGTVFGLGALRAAAADEDQRGLSDQQFVAQASAAGLAEVNLARLALEQSNNADVKKFAQHLIDDLTKANKELNSLADKHRIPPAQTMDAQHQMLMQRLGQLRGEAFDRAFLDAMAKDHKEAISLFERESKDGQDKDLKKFASDTVDTLKHHLDMAEKASGSEKERGKESTDTDKERSKGSSDKERGTDKERSKSTDTEKSKESTDKEKGATDKSKESTDKEKGTTDKSKESKDKESKER
jgi:putative membrane protein